MPRILSIILLVILVVVGIGAVSTAALAASSPLLPNSLLFVLQNIGENARYGMTTNPVTRMEYAHLLLDYRGVALDKLAGKSGETDAIFALNTAVNRAADAMKDLVIEQRLLHGRTLLNHLADITQTMDRIRKDDFQTIDEFESLAAKISTLRSMLQVGPPSVESLDEITSWTLGIHAPRGDYTLAMLRQGETGGFTHAMFPLSQQHERLTCTQCHTSEDPTERPQCQNCHGDMRPAGHFEGDCGNCHFTAGFVPARMNHGSTISDCQSCHLDRLPAEHFPGQCSQCHVAPNFVGGVTPEVIAQYPSPEDAWRLITFNHAVAGVESCQLCHESWRPPQHFRGECSLCHTTTAFIPASFNHTQDANCINCHFLIAPADHYVGQCSMCHTTPLTGTVVAGWREGSYDHVNGSADCASCHTATKPAVHYEGQCFSCHTVDHWLPASFSHVVAGAVDCVLCHTKNAPQNHYTLQCSECHTNTGWIPANFTHPKELASNCFDCHLLNRPSGHYTLVCSTCHNTNTWKPASFDHQAAGATDCIGCHDSAKPAGHYALQCSSCHSTNAWRPVNFNHALANAVDCLSCHSATKPANHFLGQCSTCHITSAWLPASFNHAAYGAVDCVSCHSADRPAGHYVIQCSGCHTTTAWKPVNFNHELAGATDCIGCHLSKMPAAHIQAQCSGCHTTSGWLPSTITHTFPLDHGDANARCTKCHVEYPPAYTCFGCHTTDELQKAHPKKDLLSLDCMQCHPDGEEPER